VPLKLPPSVTAGDPGRTNPDGKVAEMVSDAASAPVEEAVNVAVQVVMSAATVEFPEKVTDEAEVARAAIVTSLAGFAIVVSFEVATEKSLAKYVPGPGFVMPSTAIVPAAELARAQLPVRVTVTLWPMVAPVGVPVHMPAKLPPNVTVGVGGRT
jgi:hypothetical protein